MRKEFNIQQEDEIKIKYVNEVGELNDLVENSWEHCKELAITNQIQLGIELIPAIMEEDESNYEEEFEEEVVSEQNKQIEPINLKEMKPRFKELRLILQIKNIKKGDALKYILHGVRDEENNKKSKQISIATLSEQIEKKIGFSKTISQKIAKYLIEKPNDEGKIEQQGDEKSHFSKT